MGERVSIVVISDQLYSFPLVYRAICHFTGKILGPGGGHVRSKFETIPFPTSIFRFLSHRSSLFQPLFRRLFISFPPFHAVMNVPLFLSRSRFASVSLFLALSFPTPVPPTLPFTSRLWILLSNTYVARAATRLDVCACVVACVQCARTRACARRVHARWQRTQANGKARVLISIFDASTHAMGRDTTTRPFLSAAVLREREHGR